MADVDLRADEVAARTLAITDSMIAAVRTEVDAAMAFKLRPLSDLVTLIFANLPSDVLATLGVDTAITNALADYSTTDAINSALTALLTDTVLQGSPTAPTATAGDNSTQVATTAFVAAALAGLGSGSFSVVTSVPQDADGNDGDLRLRESTGVLYRKASGSWSAIYTDQVGVGGGITQAQLEAYAQSRLLWIIPAENVAGTVNAIEITTGSSLTELPDGALFRFPQDQGVNTGAVTISVDGLPAQPFRRSDGAGAFADLGAGELEDSQEQMAMWLAAWNLFAMVPIQFGTMAKRNVGNAQGEVPVLNAEGRFAPARLPIPSIIRVPTVGGTVNAITLTTGHGLTSLVPGQLFTFQPIGGNSGAVTVAVDGMTARQLIKSVNRSTVGQLARNDLGGTRLAIIQYDELPAPTFYLISTGAIGTAAILEVGTEDGRLPLAETVALLDGTHAFTAPVAGVDPTDDAHLATKAYVDGSMSTPGHTSYCATSADAAFTEAEFTGGNSGQGNVLTVPTYTESMYVGFARPTSAGAISQIYFYAQGAGRGNNQIGAWTVEATELDIGGENHYVIRSNGPLTAIDGVTFVVEVV